MRAVERADLEQSSSRAYAVVARSSGVAPEFLVAGNGSGRLMAARWRRRRARLSDPQLLGEHLVSYCVAGGARCSLVADGVRTDHVQQPGALTFLHAGQQVQWALDASSEVVHLHLYFAAAAMSAYADANLGVCPEVLRNYVAFRDPWLEGYMRLLLSEYDLYGSSGRLADSLFLDQTENLLIGRLLFAQVAGGRVPGGAAAARARISPLRPRVLRLVDEFIGAHVAHEIRLEHLAALAAMSVDHFVRAFRAATGLTPHRYVLQRRMEAARELLREEGAPVATVAQRCGFASAAHFSAAFHQRYGLTPSQYRGRS